MNNTQNVQQFERLPLRLAYEFLTDNGLGNEANEIKQSTDKYKSQREILKRAKVVALLEQNGLLDKFVGKCWRFGATEDGQKKIKRYKRVYSSFRGVRAEGEVDEEDSGEETRFAYENDLREYLSRNLVKIEPGLVLFKDEDGDNGVEYEVDDDGRRIDILAIDKDGIPVVVELKVSRGHERVIGQSLYYRNKVKQLLKSGRARVVIVAREISPELAIASEDLADVELYEYKLSVNLEKVPKSEGQAYT